MSPVIQKLPILILSPHNRCNCRCLMCDIWKTTDAREMSPEDFDAHLAGIDALGVEWVVLTGGEPLMHRDLFRFCQGLRARGIRITLLSSGLLLERHAEPIVRNIDEVIVSLDGPPAIHDRIRRVPGAFEQLARGIAAMRAIDPACSVKARCTVQRLNCGALADTVDAARAIGIGQISFLAADLTSPAFNRQHGWESTHTSKVEISIHDIDVLRDQIQHLIDAETDEFVAESPAKLARIVRHFEAHLDLVQEEAPPCNAPWVSAVVETDGTVKPCFFHAPIGKVSAQVSLSDVINGFEAIAFRKNLDVASNPVCRQCVCSLNWKNAYKPTAIVGVGGLVKPLT